MLSATESWARTTGLFVVLVTLGTTLLIRMVHAIAGRVGGAFADASAREGAAEHVIESYRHLRGLTQAAEWALVSLAFFVASVLVLVHLGVPLSTLVAPATVVGVAVGFGAQRIVQDILAGFFLFAERQFGVGDTIRISPVGSATGTTGTVEELTLRVTKLRVFTGELVIVGNGEIGQVTNLSKGWAQVVIDLPVAFGQDVDLALSTLEQVVRALADEDQWSAMLLEPPQVTGVESVEVGYVMVRIVARTRPGQQGDLGRELRQRSVIALHDAGIATPAVPPLPGTTSSA